MEERTDMEIIKPILFFSVDILDSASYKSIVPEKWGTDFRGFYQEFGDIFDEKCKTLESSGHSTMVIPPPTIWKTLGDELLFYANINDAKRHEQGCDLVFFYTVAFVKSLHRYNEIAHEKLKKNEHAFKVKGCAWFADVAPESYPKYGNFQIEIGAPPNSENSHIDFVGRQIDIGFRISKYSSLNRLVLSVEYCILLLRDNYLTLKNAGLALYYDGRKPLKGPLETLGYPLVYVEMNDRFHHSERELLSEKSAPADLIELMELLQEYLYLTNGILYYPFIHKEDRLFKTEPFEDEGRRVDP